jgi:hypothetical protein
VNETLAAERDARIKQIEAKLVSLSRQITDLQVEQGKLKAEYMGLRHGVQVGMRVEHKGRDPFRRGIWTVGKVTQYGIFGYKEVKGGGLSTALRELPRPFHVLPDDQQTAPRTYTPSPKSKNGPRHLP